MKAFLLYADRDATSHGEVTVHEQELIDDLHLNLIWDAMAAGDPLVRQVCQSVVLSPLSHPAEMVYRQGVLADLLRYPDLVRELYDLLGDTQKAARKEHLGILARYPESVLRRGVRLLELYTPVLRRLRQIADTHHDQFTSTGLTAWCARLQTELDDQFFTEVAAHVRRLQLPYGVFVSARLGRGGKGRDYLMRQPQIERLHWWQRLFRGGPPSFTYHVPDRDEAGYRALTQLRERGVNVVADALGQSVDHIAAFFTALRTELAFYLGCLNLHRELTGHGMAVCWPDPQAAGDRPQIAGDGLYDPALALHTTGRLVGNAIAADGTGLIVITGANQGGKSTFLRSLGLCQVLMQAGMYAPATALRASVVPAVYTHFKREEDTTMQSGKLDEELARISAIADVITPGCLLLCNESFAATNEREGTLLAHHVLDTMLDAGIRVVIVTHLFELAATWHEQADPRMLFLAADRDDTGQRTYRIVPAAPEPSSHGDDIYRSVFGTEVSQEARR